MKDDASKAIAQFHESIRILMDHFREECPLFTQYRYPQDLTDKHWCIDVSYESLTPQFNETHLKVSLYIGDSTDQVCKRHTNGYSYARIDENFQGTEDSILRECICWGDELCAVYSEVIYRERGFYILLKKDNYVPINLRQAIELAQLKN